MPDHDITLGELARRLEAYQQTISSSVDGLAREMREERRTASEQYLRRDVYEANRKADGDDVKEIRDGLKAAEQFKRQIIVGACVGFLLIVANIIVALLGLPGAGGGLA